MKIELKIISFFLIILTSCNNSKSDPDAKNNGGSPNVKVQEDKNKLCYSTLKVSAFDEPWPTICPSAEKIMVNKIYNNSSKNIVEIERNNRSYAYSVGDSFPLTGINQENSMAFVLKIKSDSDYAILKIRCNCN